MPAVQHSSFPHAEVHEPRHISINGTGQSGQVITNSPSVAGTSEYRKLRQSDIDQVDEMLTVMEIDSTSVQTHYLPMDFSGTILRWIAVVTQPLVTAANTYELRIDGVQVTSTPITFAISGSAGDQESATATGANTFNTGANIEVVGTTVGNTDASVDTRFLVTIRRA